MSTPYGAATADAMRPILSKTFRANPSYQLVVFDRLSSEERFALAGLQEDPDFYGILRPLIPSLQLKSVCKETALLFYTLQMPGPLPEYVRNTGESGVNQAIGRLVLDEVLQVESNGQFVSGAAAHPLIYHHVVRSSQSNILGRLSLEALQYAQELNLQVASELSARLYFYNRQPTSPAWRHRCPSPETVAEYLGVQEGGHNRSLLDGNWTQVRLPADNNVWIMWSSKWSEARSNFVSRYKLYVSPRAEYLPQAVEAVIEVLTDMRVGRFKVGKDVYGVLRPDKLVAYFEQRHELHDTANRLLQRLGGIPAQGVPFTASIDTDGLISWGMDPPRQQRLPWRGTSWRLWVTDRLAVALLAARTGPLPSVPPWQFALDRLQLEGVDTYSWVPAASIWDTGRGG